MAKKVVSTYLYPSRYGSSSSMIVRQEGDNYVLADEFGEYTTSAWYLDKNCADPNRTSEKRLSKLFGGRKDKS